MAVSAGKWQLDNFRVHGIDGENASHLMAAK